MLRITFGKYRGRKIFSNKLKARPAIAVVRESVFNIISSHVNIHGCKVLDLFCGSGSLSFEALSRGAGSALLIDINYYNLQLVKKTSEYLGVLNNVTIVCCDIEKLFVATEQYDIIFVDPPYNSPYLVYVALDALKKLYWIKSESIVILRVNKKISFVCPLGYTILVERIYGISKVVILQCK